MQAPFKLNRFAKATCFVVLSAVAAQAEDLSILVPSSEPAALQIQEAADAEIAAPMPMAKADGTIEIINERYASGAIKVRRAMTQDEAGNYILHGEWTMWDEKGNVLAEGTYRNHKRHGAWTRYHMRRDEAQLFAQAPFNEFELPFISKATFQDGKLDGIWLIVDAKGRKVSEWEYDNGVRDGLCTWYYASGHKMEESTYRDGLLEGQRRLWDKTSKLIKEETYQAGRMLAPKAEYYAADQKKSEGTYLHAQIVISTMDDWWAAKPVTYKAQGTDIRHGHWVSYYSNGKKMMEGRYENDKEVGEFTWWYPNGQVRTVGHYKDGKREGLWVWHHENGQKAAQGEFHLDATAGSWSYWKEDGRLYQKADFAADDPAIVGTPDEDDRRALLGPINAPTKR